ncbi:hypothetical protein FIBSPDRAFT_956575 [Athelia psychrophila]|uniref:F-box domain-containing protein n=1 Tax=Athelia psychrophila TaxID=1759441 RepID=A0A166GVD6_9AGAM|nr:hypothetical protein FIBSPDRAFT_956575 [Fibularhizoctonia sp. CBS 109695]
MPSRFPPEIVDAIIDHLHADRLYLANCSLVCRAWVAASRYHLIDTLWLRADTALRRFPVLQSPLCTLWPYVRHLRLYDQRFYPDTVVHSPKGLGLSRLGAVETLLLHGMQWPARNTLGAALLSGFGRVRDLEICNSRFKTGADVLDFVNAFPLLERLVLSGNGFRREGPVALHRATKMGQARPIALYLKSIMNNELFILYNLLLAFGPLLTGVQLGPPAFLREVSEEWSLLLDLGQNTSLRSLTFDSVGHDQWTPNLSLPSVEWMLKTVSTLRSAHLERFKIKIVTGGLYSLGNMGLDELDRMLNHPRFARLREVVLDVVSLENQFSPEVAKGYIACYLPGCHKRNILLVSYAM